MEERAMTPRALIDASSAILLFKAGLIEPCCEAFRLRMTRSVFDEVTVTAQPGAVSLRKLGDRQPGVTILDDPAGTVSDNAADVLRLHRGERDTLHHYLNGAARFVIIDDGKGVQICRRHSIPHVNALLCPKLLYYCGRMPGHQVPSFFGRIHRFGRYSTSVVTWAQECGRSDLAFFIDDRRGVKQRATDDGSHF
jgi:hypothetical protein